MASIYSSLMGLLAIMHGRTAGLDFFDFLSLEYAAGPLSVNEAAERK